MVEVLLFYYEMTKFEIFEEEKTRCYFTAVTRWTLMKEKAKYTAAVNSIIKWFHGA